MRPSTVNVQSDQTTRRTRKGFGQYLLLSPARVLTPAMMPYLSVPATVPGPLRFHPADRFLASLLQPHDAKRTAHHDQRDDRCNHQVRNIGAWSILKTMVFGSVTAPRVSR